MILNLREEKHGKQTYPLALIKKHGNDEGQ